MLERKELGTWDRPTGHVPGAPINESPVDSKWRSFLDARKQKRTAARERNAGEIRGRSIRRVEARTYELTQERFDRLLAFLDADRERAGSKYETIHRGLVRFFAGRGCRTPADQADETINVVATKIPDGVRVQGGNPSRYFYGVARLILKQHWRRPESRLESLDHLRLLDHPLQEGFVSVEHGLLIQEAEQELAQLERCLDELAPESRLLILKYYERQGLTKTASRRVLAESLGIGLSTLRVRSHRIRGLLRDRLNGVGREPPVKISRRI
ncbi:MAG TPA: sigma-70 family RNA polymerase sigma factor [Blastocatellia bacterium]|nr:sigma-70 family RNA polymerase sigma factor [Blastocatellia bacterium]